MRDFNYKPLTQPMAAPKVSRRDSILDTITGVIVCLSLGSMLGYLLVTGFYA